MTPPVTTKAKLAVVFAAIIVPGGFLALFGAWFANTLARTPRGQRFLEKARGYVPTWALRRLPARSAPVVPLRQAA
jgi:hypothetical protein